VTSEWQLDEYGPTTAEALMKLYPALTGEEVAKVAEIEAAYSLWHVWPMVGYPANHVWYARRYLSSMVPLRTAELSKVPGLIEQWMRERSPFWAGT